MKGHHSSKILLAAAIAVFLVAGQSVTAQDKGAPPWGEFLKRFKKDPLLKTPYHMSPETEVKGLAAKIRARELDIPNRKKAIRYLKDLDCTQFPEAKEMLVSLLKVDPEDDTAEKWEEVRFEAAKGLRDMLARHSCNPETQGNACDNCDESLWQQCCTTVDNAGKRSRGERTKAQKSPCHCTSCCDAKTLNALAKTAYEMNEKGCCYEPSLRVREMAVEAIKACGIPCNYKPYYGEFDEEPGPPAVSDEPNPIEPPNPELVPASPKDGEAAEPADQSLQLPAPEASLQVVPTPITRLSNLCIVSLRHGNHVKPTPGVNATYRGRVYYFANDAAKNEFQLNPERFAIAFGGCDPVHFLQTHLAVEGRFLAEHDEKLYMFATQENHEIFKANPERYQVKPAAATRVVSN